jgi:hypothetical protein
MHISYAHISNDDQTLNLQHNVLKWAKRRQICEKYTNEIFFATIDLANQFIKRFGMSYGVAEQLWPLSGLYLVFSKLSGFISIS